MERAESETFFKLVAVEPDGRYVSIFDGTTEYAIGSTLSKEVRAGHKGGLYVCESVLDLLKQGPLPSRSARLDAPWAVAQLVGWGQKLRYDLASGGAKFALENLVPVAIVPFAAASKQRFLTRCARQQASAREARGGAPASTNPLRLTPDEIGEVLQDWRALIELIGEE